MNRQVLFHGIVDATEFAVLAAGPAAGDFWDTDVIFICNLGTSNIGFSLQQVKGMNDITLLNSTNLIPGETVTIGPIVLDPVDSLKAKVSGGSASVVGYGLANVLT